MASKKTFIDINAVTSELQRLGVTNAEEEALNINSKVKTILFGYKEKKSIAKEQYKSAAPFLEVYESEAGLNLPQWVNERLHEARVFGPSAQLIIFPDGKKYQINNPLNDLSASEWLNFTPSVFSTFYTTSGNDSFAYHIRKIHPSPKPPQLMRDIISFFTKENEIVLDYFMGVGGSLLGAGLCGRKAIGIDLSQTYIDAYKLAADELGLPIFPAIQGDCLDILKNQTEINRLTGGGKIDLILIDPPYGDMMSREKTGGDVHVYGNVATPFTNDPRDFGNMNVSDCLESLKLSIERALAFLKVKGYIVIFIKDFQPKKKKVNLLHAEIVHKINEIDNIQYKGLRIWADKSAKLFPYGYPLSFVANQIHQYILVFRKEK